MNTEEHVVGRAAGDAFDMSEIKAALRAYEHDDQTVRAWVLVAVGLTDTTPGGTATTWG